MINNQCHFLETGKLLSGMLTLIASTAAFAMQESECKDMHALVDLAFQNFNVITGPIYQRKPGEVALLQLSRPAKPFDNCRIIDFEPPPPARILQCDIASQLGIEPTSGEQTEASRDAFMRSVQLVAANYSNCFFKRPIGPRSQPASNNRTGTTWIWGLESDSEPSFSTMVTLKLEQANVGQRIGTPSVLVQFSRIQKRGAR